MEVCKINYLSRVSSSKWLRSQAMYSSAASVTLGHHERSNERSLRRFSAINSMPSSVILEQPDNDNTVKLGKVCTANNKQNCFLKAAIALIFFLVCLPILTMPWFVISQQDCSLKILRVPVCFGLKYERAESVT